MDLVTKIVAFCLVFVDVLHCPCARDDGLDSEDIRIVTIYLWLNDTGNIGLKFHIIDEEQFAILVDLDKKVSFVGSVFDVAGVKAEDAGGVVSRETDGVVVAIVVTVDGHMYLLPRGSELYWFTNTYFGFD